MTVELRIALVIASFLTAALMLRRIRRSKVRIEDSVFWIVLSAAILIMSIFPQIADACAAALHIYQTTNFLFLFFIFVLMVKLFTMSVHMSQLESKLERTVQEQALSTKEAKENQGDAGKVDCADKASGADKIGKAASAASKTGTTNGADAADDKTGKVAGVKVAPVDSALGGEAEVVRGE